MAKKEFTFRGKELGELEGMSTEQFARLCNSRARKTLLKGVDKKFMEKLRKAREQIKAGKYPRPVKTHHRDHIVIPQMIGLPIGIHNGKEFITVEIREKMLGHYLGEFVLTRKRLQHGKAGIGATKSSTAITARG